MNDEIGEVHETVNGFEWKIENFLSLSAEENEWFFGPSFERNGKFWYLAVDPNHVSDSDSDEYVNLYLFRETCNIPISMEITLSLKTVNGEKYLEKNSIAFFGKKSKFSRTCNWYILRSELIRKKADLLPSGILTVVLSLKIHNFTGSDNTFAKCSSCKETLGAKCISFHEKCLDRPIKCPDCSNVLLLQNWLHNHECQKENFEGESSTSMSSVIPPKSKALLDFKQLYLKQENCDMVLRVKRREFSAHKAILTARSPVFASTFRNEMKEKETGIVLIEDCDPSSFSDFLCFLYCEEMEILGAENVFSLFIVADKYDVTDLRTNCLEFIKENLSVDTFCETITTALQYTETQLLHSSTDFFIENAEEVVETVKWQSFAVKNPTEGNELFIKYIKSVKNSKK